MKLATCQTQPTIFLVTCSQARPLRGQWPKFWQVSFHSSRSRQKFYTNHIQLQTYI